ncbi:uncharacterized protein N0V89_003747 [Didymosphaeria variabile]|uniref:FAD dependent oxidoreductase domain-containing protein n=1 Tax=Didymosphaeria variabile TaxID=1932322 RepID=A0A9W8XPA9_9PLEO|nr:uncharacterized protein N0V89_003747 [Didymosphaeria variabile]KAJ4355727.1 hypothetical protein N0V89_003747 [Didymosphaeria variabile]
MDILENNADEAEKMGIQRVPIVKYSVDEDNDPSAPRLWFTNLVQDFALVPTSDLPPNGPKSGNSFTTVLINPTQYLTYLFTRAKSLGAKTITATLPASNSFAATISTAFGYLDRENANLPQVVINCTGLGASKLCDESMFPIRGQTLLVRITPPPPTSRITIWDSTPVTYILPRRITPFSSEPSDSTFFIGGTNDKNNWDPIPTPEISKGILERVSKVMAGWAGKDAQIEVLREQVGLRPGRKDGPRVELEEVDVGGKKIKVVHQYGHAGAGFQFSIGSVRKALGLVEEALG